MNVESEFQKYMQACYGNGPVLETQFREVKQAFLSGMTVVVTSQNDLPTLRELKSLLIENRSLPDPERN